MQTEVQVHNARRLTIERRTGGRTTWYEVTVHSEGQDKLTLVVFDEPGVRVELENLE